MRTFDPQARFARYPPRGLLQRPGRAGSAQGLGQPGACGALASQAFEKEFA